MSEIKLAPAPGKRPRDRRQMTIATAAQLIYERGYRNVTMGDIAQAMSIGPSALYRHFSGKQELLGAVLADTIDTFGGALRSEHADTLSSAIHVLVTTTVKHNQFGVLWQREGRHLDEPERARCRDSIRGVARQLAALLLSRRPDVDPVKADLLAWGVLAVLASVSFQHVELPIGEYEQLVFGAAMRAAEADLPDGHSHAVRVQVDSSLKVQSRREAILATAIEMFAERGYHEVGIEVIGAAVGLSGPGLYQYFPTKIDLLIAALTRVGEWLQLDLQRILAGNNKAERALDALLHAYAGFSLGHREMIDVLIAEVVNLPAEHRRRFVATRRDYLAEWSHLLHMVHPEFSEGEARVRIQAAMTVTDDFARTPHLRALPWIERAMYEIGRGLLHL
jgi:AcrR family transcriptional regulator